MLRHHDADAAAKSSGEDAGDAASNAVNVGGGEFSMLLSSLTADGEVMSSPAFSR